MSEGSGSMIPQPVISNLAGDSEAIIVRTIEEPITTSSGAATGQIVRYVGELRHGDGRMETFRVIRKSLRPLDSGRHAAFAKDPTHWAYWRRELLAYSSDILPAGPGLVAPRCFGTDGNDLYLEDIAGPKETIDSAAMRHCYTCYRHIYRLFTGLYIYAVSILVGGICCIVGKG